MKGYCIYKIVPNLFVEICSSNVSTQIKVEMFEEKVEGKWENAYLILKSARASKA